MIQHYSYLAQHKNETIKQYGTIWNNNDYTVEQNEKQVEQEMLFWGESRRQEWKYWYVTVQMNNENVVEQNDREEKQEVK